jgi:transcriptional regulator with XRE-family HTH domain
MASETYLADLRSKMHITQDELAALLQVRRYYIAKIENGSAGLNAALTRQLGLVHLPEQFQKKGKSVKAGSSENSAVIRKSLEKQIKSLEISLYHAKNHLEEMRTEWDSETMGLEYLAVLRTGTKATGKDRSHILSWVDQQMTKKLKRMSKFHPSRQELLKCRIAGLEAEIRFARNLLTPKRVRVAASVKS